MSQRQRARVGQDVRVALLQSESGEPPVALRAPCVMVLRALRHSLVNRPGPRAAWVPATRLTHSFMASH